MFDERCSHIMFGIIYKYTLTTKVDPRKYITKYIHMITVDDKIYLELYFLDGRIR